MKLRDKLKKACNLVASNQRLDALALLESIAYGQLDDDVLAEGKALLHKNRRLSGRPVRDWLTELVWLEPVNRHDFDEVIIAITSRATEEKGDE